MCLYVQQKSGSRIDAAQRAIVAVEAGNIALAEEIYFSVVGEKFAPHNREANAPWLKYCMAARIASHVEDKYWPKGRPSHNDDRRYYNQLRRNAERAYGGVWEVCYEY